MKAKMVNFRQPVTMVGGGALSSAALQRARDIAPHLIAADGAANALHDLDLRPDAIIGDMDSIGDLGPWRDGPTSIIELNEQDSTDFEKCLYATDAPLYLGVGFTGRRMDHSLAVLHAMLVHPGKRVILVGEDDLVMAVPPSTEICLDLPEGAVVSFFPFAEATGTRSVGLRWSVEGLRMSPGRQIGTSNRATGGDVRFAFDRAGVFLMLAPAYLSQVIAALGWCVSEA